MITNWVMDDEKHPMKVVGATRLLEVRMNTESFKSRIILKCNENDVVSVDCAGN